MITCNGGEVLPEEVTQFLFDPARDQRRLGISADVPAALPDAAARKTAVANYQQLATALFKRFTSAVTWQPESSPRTPSA